MIRPRYPVLMSGDVTCEMKVPQVGSVEQHKSSRTVQVVLLYRLTLSACSAVPWLGGRQATSRRLPLQYQDGSAGGKMQCRNNAPLCPMHRPLCN